MISTVNDKLSEQPGLLNTDPYGEGWIFELALDAAADDSDLLDSQKYQQLIEG